MSVDLAGQLELAVEASLGEDALKEGDEETLVKLVVDAAAVDGLSHQGLQSRPGDLVRCDILTTLRACEQTQAFGQLCESEIGYRQESNPSDSWRHFLHFLMQQLKLCDDSSRTFAVSSSQVSTVSQAERRSDSPNSYFLDQPSGA